VFAILNVPVREYSGCSQPCIAVIFPYGNFILGGLVRYTPKLVGSLIRQTRKHLGVTQKDLALTSGTGLRFVIDLEKGKETCEIGKALTVLQTLGIKLTLTPPGTAKEE
jgi:y4mF family transcriptional regulator